MSNTKICIDCGKQFTNEGNVICNNCIGILKRRFWSSIKIAKTPDNINGQARQNDEH
jgi:predicted amidophosphoribosyltransferase